MKVLINTHVLKNALQDIVGVVSKDLSMPILSHVLVEKNNKHINITGTNLEMQITAKADFLESDDFDPITVSGRKLYEIVRSLDDQNIQISTTKNRLILKTNNSSFKLSTLPSNNFPTFEDLKPIETFTITQTQLLDLLNWRFLTLLILFFHETNPTDNTIIGRFLFDLRSTWICRSRHCVFLCSLPCQCRRFIDHNRYRPSSDFCRSRGISHRSTIVQENSGHSLRHLLYRFIGCTE